MRQGVSTAGRDCVDQSRLRNPAINNNPTNTAAHAGTSFAQPRGIWRYFVRSARVFVFVGVLNEALVMSQALIQLSCRNIAPTPRWRPSSIGRDTGVQQGRLEWTLFTLKWLP